MISEMSNTVQIIKACFFGTLTMPEAMVIVPLTKAYHDDRANEYIAIAVDIPNRDEAFALVDRLNEISVNAGGDADWYVGDEDEEYVYVE
jgi:hypothetical protein